MRRRAEILDFENRFRERHLRDGITRVEVMVTHIPTGADAVTVIRDQTGTERYEAAEKLEWRLLQRIGSQRRVRTGETVGS